MGLFWAKLGDGVNRNLMCLAGIRSGPRRFGESRRCRDFHPRYKSPPMIGLSIRAGHGAAPLPTSTPGLVEKGIRGERPESRNYEIGNRRYNASEFFRCIRKTPTLSDRGPLQLAGRATEQNAGRPTRCLVKNPANLAHGGPPTSFRGT